MAMVIELRLRAERPFEATTEQLYGLACALFEDTGAASHATALRPFAVWPLRPEPEHRGTAWLLRVAWLPAEPPKLALTAYTQLRLGPATCTVTEMAYRSTTQAQLAAPPWSRAARLEFLSPTYFMQNGVDVIDPDRALILGSWRRKWNASLPTESGLEIDDDAWHKVQQAARFVSFALSTKCMESGKGHQQSGFTGTADLHLDRDTPELTLATFSMLARFAEFCGTGALTTHGFGATRVSVTGGGDGDGPI